MKPFLFEIGSEEIPARFITRGLDLLKEACSDLLANSLIDHGSIKTYGTPRRLALIIDDVAEIQKDSTVEATGPPRSAAFDKSGTPTKAAVGFARSLNLDVGDLVIKKTDRGEYVSATIDKKGRPTSEILAESLPGLISSLNLPKSMRWGDGSLRFFRPIQWILAIFGGKTVSFDLEGIVSGNITYGHRFLSPGSIKLSKESEYLPFLEENSVLADIDRRKELIRSQMKDIASGLKCSVHDDEELLHTVTCLVEHPDAVKGSFEEKYLQLPGELPVTVMRTHQKYFSLVDENQNLLPHFIVISNTAAKNRETVRKGAERVIRARLEDANFYFREDSAIPFHEYVEKLRKVTFQDKLGSLYDKTERISALCSFIADRVNVESKDRLLRAALLCKADLVTGVVGEFPELQGYMGSIYAMNSGEYQEVASAIYEHYLPKSSGDSLPKSETGSIVSLADKIDSIAAFFSVDLIPTGSEDPFALRRQASGVISILQSSDLPLSLVSLIEASIKGLPHIKDNTIELRDRMLKFFMQRIENILIAEGYRYDLVDSALSSGSADVKEIKSKLLVLAGLREKPEFPDLLTSAKRVYNILSNSSAGPVNEGLLSESAEKDLYNASCDVRGSLIRDNYDSLFQLNTPINTFFDTILVMDKNPEVRENRLALLMTVKSLFDSLGDFSKIVEH